MPPLLAEWLQALAAWPVAAFFRDSTIAYVALDASHIFSIAVVVGSLATLDFRLLGLFRAVPLITLALPLSRVAAVAVFFAVATGFLLFSMRPMTYAVNVAFLIKVSLVALGILNALALRASRDWQNSLEGEPISDKIRAAAFRSLVIWFGAVLAGRAIGFLQ